MAGYLVDSGTSPALPSSLQRSQEKPAGEGEQPDGEEGVAKQCSGFKGSQCLPASNRETPEFKLNLKSILLEVRGGVS